MTTPVAVLLVVTALAWATFSEATVTGYSNTLSDYVASATGVSSTYTFTPLSNYENRFQYIKVTNQGFSAASPQLKAICTNVLSVPTAAMSTAATGSQTATFSFATSSLLATNKKITLTFPPSLVTTDSTAKCEISSPAPTTASTTTGPANNEVIIQVKADVVAGDVTVTCSGLTLASKDAVVATTTEGMKIETETDTVAAFISTPKIGAVKDAFISHSKAVGTSGTAQISFTTSTAFLASSANKITIAFPTGLVTANSDDKCAITMPTTKTTSKYAADAITITLASDAVLAAGPVTVTCSGLTLTNKAEVISGLVISTSKDTIAATANTLAVGAVTAVAATALTLSKNPGSSKTATISFETSTAMVASSANKITMTFPVAAVTANADNQCAIVEPATDSKSQFAANAITITLAVYSTLAAGPVKVTCSGLTLSARAAVKAAAPNTGLKIETSVDNIAALVDVSAVGAVTAVVASAVSQLGPAASIADQTATISFITSTPLAAADELIIDFPVTGHITTLAADKCGISSPTGVVTTSTFVDPQLKVILSAGATNKLAAGPVTVTCSGLTLAAKAAIVGKEITGTVANPIAATGLKISTTLDTVAIHVSLPAVGAISVKFVASSDFTATYISNTVKISSAVEIWALGSSPSVSCVVSSFTNAAISSAQSSRTLLQSTSVSIIIIKADGITETTTDTLQSFPASVAAQPTRTLYLPKASSSAYKVAWIFVILTALVACL